jgi:hypothetical protein
VARGQRARRAAGAQQGDRVGDGAARADAWLDVASRRRAPPRRGARARGRDSRPRRRRASRWRCARCWRRPSGPQRWSRPIARWRGASRRIARAGGSRSTIRRASRCRSCRRGRLLLALADAASTGLRADGAADPAQASAGDARDAALEWLEACAVLDRALRGPRPAPGLGGIDRHLAEQDGRDGHLRRAAERWWPEARAVLAPLEARSGRAAAGAGAARGAARDGAGIGWRYAVERAPRGARRRNCSTTAEREAAHGPRCAEPSRRWGRCCAR